jgi:hypothetical protein
MSVYAIHKIGFFYTDDSYAASVNGTVIKIVNTIEEARQIKLQADIKSLKHLFNDGLTIQDFYPDEINYKELDEQLDTFLTENYNKKRHSALAKVLSDEHAIHILSMLLLQFHDIVEYDEEASIDTKAFKNNSRENELEEL